MFGSWPNCHRVWTKTNPRRLNFALLAAAENSPKALLEKNWSFDADYQCKIILFLQCWWSACNKANSGERKRNAQEVINDILFHFQVWTDTIHSGKQAKTSTSRPKWRHPPKDVYKINYHGSVITWSNKGRWSFVIRDHCGDVIAAACRCIGSANLLLGMNGSMC